MSPLIIPGKMVLQKEFVPQSFMYLNPDTFGLWSPSQIGTELWLDGSDSSTITETSGAISQWNDKSGNIINTYPVNSSASPTYLSNGINGNPSIDFNGTSHELLIPPSKLSLFGSFNTSFAIVAKRDNSAGRTEITFAIGNQTYGNGISDLPRWTDNIMYSQIGLLSARPTPTSVINDQPYINCVTGGSLQLSYTNGELIGTGLAQSTSSNYYAEGGAIGSGRAVSSSGRYFDGKIAEVIIFSSVLSTNERQKVEGYLAHKWGLTANLPSDHPYKTGAPTV